MAGNNCPKCQAIREFIQRQRDNPPPMSFEVEQPFRGVLDGIQAILDHKSPLELACQEAKHTGKLTKYLKMRRNNS
jgi:hypothetical protein